MFRKLFLALVLMVSPAFGQEVPLTDPTQIPTVEQTYTFTQQQTATPIQDVRDEGGTGLTLLDDGVSQQISLGFDFYFYGNLYNSLYISQNGFISFTNNANGCCSGNPLPYFTEWTEQNAQSYQYFSVNNSIFAMWSDLADFQFANPYYKSTGNSFVAGWYGVDELGTANKFTFEISLFSDSSFSINYGAFNYAGATGRTFTSGYQGDQAGEFYQIYNGNDPSSLQNTTYFVQSSEIVPIPQDPIAPDCTLNPYNPTCIINDLTDTTEPTYLTDETTGSDDGSDDGTEVIAEEELLVEESAAEEEFLDENLEETPAEETLEEMLADLEEEEDSAVEEVERIIAYRELSDEEKAAILADAISKTTLESALSIAATAETSAVSQNSFSESSIVSESSTRTSNALSVSEITAETTLSSLAASPEMFVDATREETTTSDISAGSDILDAGRTLGQAALKETLAATSESASDSVNQAESVAATSSSESLAVIASVEATTTITDSTDQAVTETELVAEEKDNNQKDQEQTELVASETTEQSNETQSEIVVADSAPVVEAVQETTETRTEETVVADIQTETTETVTENVEVVVAEVTQSEQTSVAYQDMESAMEVFASNLPNQIAVNEQEELENSIVQQAIASSQQTEDDNRMGFAEAEAVTIANDPALANAFNVQPNTASLELLGVLGSAGQDKSDAELRAEQVVAANKEEQDAINANYMEADQSGILAAIGSETDVTAYRTAMLRDNNNWYKPEDIYKGVIIKDNVRGSYFLEKGNTDTYKKMVDEQYK